MRTWDDCCRGCNCGVKKTLHAAEQDTEEGRRKRQAWGNQITPIDPRQLGFVEESGGTTAMTRRYGRGLPGEQGLKEFHKGGVDLVISDLVLPQMDGLELVHRIKELSPQTPVILFSGKVRACERGTEADVFLPKRMYASAELLERIHLLLIRKRGPKRADSGGTPEKAAC